MKLSVILGDKGGSVITIEGDTSLRAAATVLDDHKIGSIVAVDSNGGIIGVISERDIVRRIAQMGADALELPVSQVMTRDVITATGDMTVEDGLSCMTDRRIRHLPVVDSNARLIGIVSIGDLVKHKIAVTEAEAEAMKQYIHAG